MTTTSQKPQKINFTDSAALKVKELILEADNHNLKLRVYIIGGGCSGFQYGFSFEQEEKDDDFIFENHGVYLVVDPVSFQYLMGADIDYKDDIQGASFIIRNPNAKTTCGCGSSFST